MMHVRRFATSILALLMLLGLTTSLALAAPPAQDPDNGKTLWEQGPCQRCHGPAGEGLWAGPLAGNQKTAQEWIAQVRSPRQNMPTFSPTVIPDEAIIDMHAYLTSLTAPADFTRADAGLPADAHPGQMLIVEKRCVACHTETGPIMRFTERGETPTAAAVIKQLRTPIQFMPAFSEDQVSDEEATQIADFLASQVTNQTPPANLPQSGGAGLAWLPLVLTLAGAGLTLTGLLLRRLVVKN